MMQSLLAQLDTSPPSDQVFGYANLLQELLLTLVGFSGDAFIVAGSRDVVSLVPHPGRCNIFLSTDLDWVDAPDRALINELAQLGFHYLAIRTFIEHERAGMVAGMARPMKGVAAPHLQLQGATLGLVAAQGQARQGSVYRQALASGLTEALDVYQAAVVAIQVQVMERSQAPVLSSLHHQLHDYKVLLPQLHHLVYRVSGSDNQPPAPTTIPDTTGSGEGGEAGQGPLAGAAVLALLSELTRGGLPALQSTALRLLWHCNQALHKQLSSWMVYGHLTDPYDEFFIRRKAWGAHIATPAGAPAPQQEQNQQQQQHQQQPHQQPHHQHQHHQQGFDFVHTFEVLLDRLPACISVDTAEAVAFVGKAVLLLNSPAGEFRGRQLLPHQDTLHAAQVLRELQGSPTFDRVAFERCVTALRTKVAALLWQLVVQQAGLMGHLFAFKDYFLLAKGEFAHAFLVEARRLLALPPHPKNADAEVGVPWQQAALKSSAQHDTLFNNFTIHWAPAKADRASLPAQARAPQSAEVPAFDGNWDGLWLEARVDWPLGLLLTPNAMARYNTMFQLLLRLRRVQLALEGAWVTLCEMSKDESDRRRAERTQRPAGAERDTGKLLLELQQLRLHMAHLITNLQIYIQVDVIESNFSLLEQRVAAAQDYTEVERAHANYLHTLMAQCFLTTPTMSRVIGNSFKHAGDLSRLIDDVHLNRAPIPSALPVGPPQTPMQRAQAISAGFKQNMSELYAVLHSSKLLDVNKAPYLRQLYLRLDYNGWLTSNTVGQHWVVGQATEVARGPVPVAAPGLAQGVGGPRR